jgi:hypothetical protein
VVTLTDAQQLNSLNSSSSDADLFAGQTGPAANVAEAPAPDAESDAATVVRATRFEHTILLDTVRRPVNAITDGEVNSL